MPAWTLVWEKEAGVGKDNRKCRQTCQSEFLKGGIDHHGKVEKREGAVGGCRQPLFASIKS
jgi:hypothetical protein